MLNDFLQQAETIVMPVVGYRAWQVDADNNLQSLVWNIHWPSRRKMLASCRTFIGGCQRLPATGNEDGQILHRCGIYAFKSETLLIKYLWEEERKASYFPPQMNTSMRHLILGTVYLWGKVIECSDGYRGECAYPKEIHRYTWSAVTESRLENIAYLYGISCAWHEKDIDVYRRRTKRLRRHANSLIL